MAEDKTPEQVKANLEAELQALEESFSRRLEESKGVVDEARAEGKIDAANIFPDGSLGRVDEDPSQEIQDLVQERRDLLAQVQSDPEGQLSARKNESERLLTDFDKLLAETRDPNSPGQRAAREKGGLEINKQLRGNLRNIAGLSQSRGVGIQSSLVGDALQGATDSRANLERDLTIEREKSRERITEKGASARSESLRRQEDVINKQRDQVSGLQNRLEDLQGAIRQDTLQRQQFNLEQRAAEQFGRLGTEEGRVNQSLALVTGARSQTLSESQAAKSNVRAEESLEIQRIEAEKPAPSGGSAGKSILCVQYWLTGDIPTDILEGDFTYTFTEDNITEEVRMCYYSWSAWISPYILSKGLLYKIFRPFTTSWAQEMASRVGIPTARSNLLGKFLCWIGVPTHHVVGRVMGWMGYKLDEVEKKLEVQVLFAEAQEIWKRAEKRAMKMQGYEVI